MSDAFYTYHKQLVCHLNHGLTLNDDVDDADDEDDGRSHVIRPRNFGFARDRSQDQPSDHLLGRGVAAFQTRNARSHTRQSRGSVYACI